MDKIFPIYRISSFRRVVLNYINLNINNVNYSRTFSTNISTKCCNTLAIRTSLNPLVNHSRSLYCLPRSLPRQVHGLVTMKLGPTHDSLAFRKFSSGPGQLKIGFWPKPDYRPTEVFRMEFLNGIRVAATKHTGAQIGACTIMFRAGSRCEWGDELGASHFLRAAASLSGCAYSGYIKSRYLQQYGSYITTNSDRQTISFTLRCPITHFNTLKHYLLDTAKRCQYDDHELNEVVKPIIRGDLKRRPMEEHCMDLLQQACWAGPLNNPVYCNENRIADMSQETLVKFRDRYFKTSRCSVGSCGLPATETAKVAEYIEVGLTVPDPETPEPPSFPRGGCEVHDYGPGDTYIALAVPTCAATTDLNQQYTFALLVESLGTCNLQGSEHSLDRLPAPPLGTAAGALGSFRAFSVSYRDCGMFGIMVKTTSECARDAAFTAVESFSRIKNITPEQICVGKKRLQTSMCMNDEDCVTVSEGMALQAANCHYVDDARVAMDHISAIPNEAVMSVARQVSASMSSMAMAVVGDVNACPDDCELLQ